MTQQNPWSIQVSAVYGCNRRCKFCAVNHLDIRNKERMPFHTFKAIVDGYVEWGINPRIDIAPFGEPLLNPHIYEMLRYNRMRNSKSYVFLSSNGDRLRISGELDLDKIDRLFYSGLNLLVIDVYDSKDKYEETIETLEDTGYDLMPVEENHYKKLNHKVQRIKIEPMYEEPIGGRARYNVGGNAKVGDWENHGMCTKPFRNLIVMPNGDVPICCDDWQSKQIMGNIHKVSLRDIWFGIKYNTMRRALLEKGRIFEPCKNCNYSGGFRKGLVNRWFR